MEKKPIGQSTSKKPGNNSDLEGNDKAPGEEQGYAELVTTEDLKGKKNDGDPSLEKDKPVKQ